MSTVHRRGSSATGSSRPQAAGEQIDSRPQAAGGQVDEVDHRAAGVVMVPSRMTTAAPASRGEHRHRRRSAGAVASSSSTGSFADRPAGAQITEEGASDLRG